jgi:beta-phosphoglucomutase-like phosphatase (HAD superfamily)
MNLVIFDIDGTLTRTNAVNDLCLVRALSDVLQIEAVNTDWTQYNNVTDRGSLEEIVLFHKGRPATPEELSSVKNRHVELLKHHAQSDPTLFAPVPGAAEMLTDLISRPGAAVALATGSWLESAEIKLRSAGLAYDRIPLATSNDALSRDEIITLAESRAGEPMAAGGFCTKTSVGDAPWDVHAADRLGYNFIGIAQGDHTDNLRDAGATKIVPDFTDGHFLRMLESIWRAEQGAAPDSPRRTGERQTVRQRERTNH